MWQRLGRLERLGLVFAATWVLHTGDHVRRGLADTNDGVTFAGTVAAILAAVALTLVATRHPTAPAVAAVVFASIAVGVSATHLLPDWGEFSEPLVIDRVNGDGWSIVAVLPEIVAAAWLGLACLHVLRRHDFAWSIPASAWPPGRPEVPAV